MIISLSCSLCLCSVTDVTTAVDILKNEFLYKSADEYIDPSGTVNGYVYTNEFLGLSYRIDSSWGYYNEEETLAFFGLTQDDLTEYEFYDMLATDTYRTQQLYVYFNQISARQMAMLNMEKYLNNYIAEVEEYNISQNFENINSEITKVEIDGRKLDAIRFSYVFDNVNGYTTRIVFPHKDYLITISAETYYTDTTADVLDNFYWLD